MSTQPCDIDAPATGYISKFKPKTKAELQSAIDECTEKLRDVSMKTQHPPDILPDMTNIDVGLHKYVKIGLIYPQGETYHVVRAHNHRPAVAAMVRAKLRDLSYQVLSGGRIERSAETKTINIHGPLPSMCVCVCVCVCV